LEIPSVSASQSDHSSSPARLVWVYELKHDGFRALAHVGDGRYRFASRRGNEMRRSSDLAACGARELKVKDAILDGEMVALDSAGRPAFYELMKRNGQPIFTGSIFFG